MSRPRCITPGTTALISRRCSQRQFLLKPSRVVNQVFLYCLAYAAQRYRVAVHAFVVMANHFHVVVTDTQGNLPQFMHWLDEYVAKALNAHYGRWENFWAPNSYSHVTLETAQDAIDKMVYTLTNPVFAGLVKRAAKWPGLTSADMSFGDVINVERPDVFFRAQGPLPDEVSLRLTRPLRCRRQTNAELTTTLREQVEQRELEIRQELKQKGRRFAGVHAIRKIHPFHSPESREPRRRLNPRIACKDPGRRVAAIARLKAFYAEYREAWVSWREGNRDVLFPHGTYQLRLQAAVACRGP